MPIFVVHARRTPEALSRIVLLFHRRRVQIDSLVAQYDARSDVLRIEVKIDEDHTRAERIAAYLYKLVDVLLVEDKSIDSGAEFHADKDGQQER